MTRRRPVLNLTKPEKPALVAAPEPVQRDTYRIGKRAVQVWLGDAEYEELKLTTVREKTTIQAAGEEGFRLWMRERGVRLQPRRP